MPRELPLLAFALLCLAVQLVQYRMGRRLERRPAHRFPPTDLSAAGGPFLPGAGRHRRGGRPDAWVACHTTRCAHLTTPHSRTPAGLECSECGHVIPGGPVHDEHDYSEYADEVERPTREDEKAAEIALDVADEERQAAEEAATGEVVDVEDDDCHAEFIDGSFTNCGCEDCEDRAASEAEEL